MDQREFISTQAARERGLLDSPRKFEPLSFRGILDDAIRYWELRRIAYNLLLTVVVLIVDFFRFGGALLTHTLMPLVVLAVLANLCYSAGYLPDLVFQYSSFRAIWLRVRPALFVFGTVLAALIAYEISGTLLLGAPWQ